MNQANTIFFPILHTETLLTVGCRINDFAKLHTINGQTKKIKLNRTLLEFRSQRTDEDKQVKLPIIKDERPLSFDLTLQQTGEHNNDGRFMLKSNSSTPFKLNGVNCIQAYIERDDHVIMGHNKIVFFTEEHKEVIGNPDYSFLENKRLMESSLNILLEGETGTGKTRLAKEIHVKSKKSGPFIHINLSAFAPTIIESELFGHVKGAFTGAHNEKRGAFLEADNGTLFLDEIDSISNELQTKLLLFLDSKTVRPVGGDRTHKCNVRLIFASGRNLNQLIECKQMRKDFYFRLASGYRICLTPLRNDPDEISRLCREFELNEGIIIPSQLIEFYKTLPWAGNKRQLIAHLNKKMILSKTRKLDFDKYDDQLICQSSDLSSFDMTNFRPLSEYRDNYAVQVYNYYNENLKKSADALKVSDKTLRAIVRKFKDDLGIKLP